MWLRRFTPLQAALAAIALALAGSDAVCQTLPLAPGRAAGQTVTPAFEGWYRNSDGTFSLSFGYYNRNEREVLYIPVGAGNFIVPADSNQGQPTHFAAGRHWGVFAVTVPADFGDRKVTWTLSIRGATYAIPGSLHPNWQIDALEGEAGSGNTPPWLKFSADGKEGQGPAGIYGAPIAAKVGVPVALDIWARDESGVGRAAAGAGRAAAVAGRGAARAGRGAAAGGRGGGTVTLTWFKHQGPGMVTFEPATARVDRTTAMASSAATFSEPGLYIVRIRANDASGVAGAGHAQCCWSNGFVKVTVSR
jgi:hypothetical protein